MRETGEGGNERLRFKTPHIGTLFKHREYRNAKRQIKQQKTNSDNPHRHREREREKRATESKREGEKVRGGEREKERGREKARERRRGRGVGGEKRKEKRESDRARQKFKKCILYFNRKHPPLKLTSLIQRGPNTHTHTHCYSDVTSQ